MASSKKTSDALVSHQRKMEVLGLILMVSAVLIALALLTYSPADAGLAQSFSLDLALENPGENRADNALGLVGAGLALLLVPGFLGYTTLLLTGLLFAWGYVLFRDREPVYLPLFSVLTTVGTFIAACLFGWLGQMLGADLLLWSGRVGRGTAAWMQRVFGTAGSLILLLLTLAVIALVAVDRDIQRSLDRFEAAFRNVRDAVWSWTHTRKEQLAQRRAQWADQRDERRQERARRREQHEQKPRSEAEESHSAAPRASAVPPAPPPPEEAPPEPPSSRTVNDLFRRGQSDSSEPPVPPRDAPSPSEEHPPAASDQTPAPPPDPPPVSPSDSAPTDSDDEENETQSGEPELKVQKRIEEEKADAIDHDTEEVPDEEITFAFPTIDLLDASDDTDTGVDRAELEENKRILLNKLETYNIEITDVNAVVGPTVTRYELTPAPGVKISRITSLKDDLAMALAAQGIRTLAPIPGKSAVGVEIPNSKRELVRIRDILGTAKFRDTTAELPVALGKSIEGEVAIRDLTKMPHLLIAGATGSGKSVGLNGFIAGLLYACHPANLKFVMIDPKKIELQQYTQIADHYIAMPEDADDPIITDIEQALGVLKSCEKEMEARYDLLSDASVRNLKAYNRRLKEGRLDPDEGHRHLPYVVVVVDELADLMMTAGKDIEGPIARLAQMARAVGIHLVLATQRPSVDVITGLIKANFPARIAYQVATRADSRTILDLSGAEGLVGNGDLLYQIGSQMRRLQGPFVSIEEVERLTAFVADQRGKGPYLLPPIDEGSGDLDSVLAVNDRDELFEQAAKVIVRRQQGSVSLLQRKLSVGYTRAARIVDQLEDAGIVGPFVGSKARDVLVADEEALDELLEDDEE